MTREEAIQELQKCKWLVQQVGLDYLDERDIPLLDMAIESLSAEPCKSTDQNVADVPSGDLISRQEAIEIIASHDETNGTEKVFTGREITDLLASLPSADRPKGEWIDREDSTDMFFLYRYECSVCGGKNVFNSSYCPNCGAHMR